VAVQRRRHGDSRSDKHRTSRALHEHHNTVTQETPYIPICDGKQHKVPLTIPRIVQTSPFIAGEALVTIIQGLQLTTNRLEIVVAVR
jgi:hypothetical protein